MWVIRGVVVHYSSSSCVCTVAWCRLTVACANWWTWLQLHGSKAQRCWRMWVGRETGETECLLGSLTYREWTCELENEKRSWVVDVYLQALHQTGLLQTHTHRLLWHTLAQSTAHFLQSSPAHSSVTPPCPWSCTHLPTSILFTSPHTTHPVRSTHLPPWTTPLPVPRPLLTQVCCSLCPPHPGVAVLPSTERFLRLCPTDSWQPPTKPVMVVFTRSLNSVGCKGRAQT